MKFLGRIVVAAIVSALLGSVATVVLSSLAACWHDACALSGTQQLALMPFYAALGAVVFAVAATRRQSRDAMFYAVRLLLLIPIVLIIVGFAAGASPRARTQFEFGSALLLSIPFWTVIVSEWWMVRRSLVSREATRA